MPDRLKYSRGQYKRAANFRTRYGVDADVIDAMVDEQEECCRICGEHRETLFVDHCHTTNVVRGLLCRECNLGIGYFRDDPERLRAAARYLG